MYVEKLWVDMSDMFDVRRTVLPQDQPLPKAIKSVSETGAISLGVFSAEQHKIKSCGGYIYFSKKKSSKYGSVYL